MTLNILVCSSMSAAVNCSLPRNGEVYLLLLHAVIVDDLLEADLFEVEDDLHYIFYHTADGAEFVVDPGNTDSRDSKTFEAAQQHAAEGVTDGLSETGLKRLEFEIAVELIRLVHRDFVRLLEI